jgi:4'-phosphopantetheinyl transferase
MALLSPMLRADFAVLETYLPSEGASLPCPITVLGGVDDAEVRPEALDGWRNRTRDSFRKILFPGTHFYMITAQAALLRTLSETLEPLIDRIAPEQVWEQADQAPALTATAAHVWSFGLDQPPERLRSFHQILSADERERAGRFVFDRDREAFIAGRGFLRTTLGRYLAIAPEALRFAYSDQGKPALVDKPLEFNLAHSHGLALLAITQRDEVGVDVEYIKDDLDAEALARGFFSPREVDALFALSAAERQSAFYAIWTRKEAYLKAIGKGLSLSLSDFDVTLELDDARLLATRHDPREASRWTLRHLSPARGYTGALAISPRVGRVWRGRWV